MRSNWISPRRWCCGIVVLSSSLAPAFVAADDTPAEPMATEPAAAQVASAASAVMPTELRLILGELRTMVVEDPTRVAIGDPKIADVKIISEKELLLQAKATGATSMIVWDHDGQHTVHLTVITANGVPEETVAQLTRLLQQLGLDNVQVKQEGTMLFLVGQVATKDDLDHVDRLATSYPGLTNLVSLSPTPPPPTVPPPPMIRLSVQVIELNRDYTEQLGVKWNQAINFTEQPFASVSADNVSPATSLVQTGQSFGERVQQPFRIGTLFRTGFTQTVNFLVSKGKARVLAEPTLVTTSGKEATSFMGSEIPIVSSTSVGINTGGVSASIEFHEVGVKLTMTPTLLSQQDKIATALKAEVSSISPSNGIQVATGSSTVTVPAFNTRRAQTELTTSSGETIVIAGLLQTQDSSRADEVPGLGGMPVFGRLFRSPTVKNEHTELVISVTPELKDDVGQNTERNMALEQALSSETVQTNDPRVQYALQVQDRIAKVLHYPRFEKLQLEGKVKLKLHLFADGSLVQVTVAESSGIESLDAAAVDAAKSQSHYPAFPPQLVERELWLELPVIFRPS